MKNELLGHQLKRSIYNRVGTLLIAKDAILSMEHMKLLDNHRMNLDPADTIKIDNKTLITTAAAEIKVIFSGIKDSGNIPIEEVNGRILPAISTVAETPDLFNILTDMQSKDDYTYRHNVGVAVFSNMIGRWLQMGTEDLAELTLAATLHDVGKIHIADTLLDKEGPYTDEEHEQMKQHTTLGYDLLKSRPGLTERAALVAIQHHEREDGTGYPKGIKGDEIDDFSKIVAVADTFHALSTHRVHRRAVPFYEAIQIMREESFGKLNSHICRLFIQRMMELTVGNIVTLTNGKTAKVILIHPVTPECPLVAVGDAFVDLSLNRYIQIEALSGAR